MPFCPFRIFNYTELRVSRRTQPKAFVAFCLMEGTWAFSLFCFSFSTFRAFFFSYGISKVLTGLASLPCLFDPQKRKEEAQVRVLKLPFKLYLYIFLIYNFFFLLILCAWPWASFCLKFDFVFLSFVWDLHVSVALGLYSVSLFLEISWGYELFIFPILH